ncbi:MAG: LysR family transcriptional regulator [Firmicutes bacterium]|nr:LysR family transcriptional regulator [Bacillota bacterium]
MDSNKIEILLSVIEEGSLSRTAEKLGYTTSGVSRAIAALEKETGFPLLERTRSGVKPNRDCKTLLPIMERIRKDNQLYTETVNSIADLDVGEIVVGTSYSTYFAEVAELVHDFTKEHASIKVDLVEKNNSELARMLEQRTLDFCIMGERDGDFRWTHFFDDELVALVYKDHPAVAKGYYLPEDFEKDPFVMQYSESETDYSLFFERTGVTPNAMYSAETERTAYFMIEANMGVTITNRAMVENMNFKNTVILPLHPAEIIPIGVGTQNLENMSPAAKKFTTFAMARYSRPD